MIAASSLNAMCALIAKRKEIGAKGVTLTTTSLAKCGCKLFPSSGLLSIPVMTCLGIYDLPSTSCMAHILQGLNAHSMLF